MDIPRTTDPDYRKGDHGFGVWAIQRALNELGRLLNEDGVYGARTRTAVVRFQDAAGIGADGVVGMGTTADLCARLEHKFAGSIVLPDHLLEGFCTYEGGMNLGAVNWSVPGGVDCGIVQRRVFEANYGSESIKQLAFDAGYQLKILGRDLRDRRDLYWQATNAVDTIEQAWRLAALRHNYPAGADHLALTPRNALSSYWTTPQSWVPAVTFNDGAAVRTPLEWCEFYSLGAPAHHEPGLVTALTTKWP